MSGLRDFFVDGPKGEAAFEAWRAEQLERLRRAFAPSEFSAALADGVDAERRMRALAAQDAELAVVAFGVDIRWRDMPAEDVPILRRQA